MAFTFDEGTEFKSIEEAKKALRQRGFGTKAILSDQAMRALSKLVTDDPAYRKTPRAELGYMEGLLDLPLGHIAEFGFVPAKGSEQCACGRTPTALDIVVTALRQGIHERGLIRDTIIGLENVFEMADGGRTGACISCGRAVVMAVYHYKQSYLYA
jgi:hypothetical protein